MSKTTDPKNFMRPFWAKLCFQAIFLAVFQAFTIIFLTFAIFQPKTSRQPFIVCIWVENVQNIVIDCYFNGF